MIKAFRVALPPDLPLRPNGDESLPGSWPQLDLLNLLTEVFFKKERD